MKHEDLGSEELVAGRVGRKNGKNMYTSSQTRWDG